MAWQFLVSLRYLTSRRREKFISLISLISVLGVAIGVAALIIVLAVMSGFDNELQDKIIGTSSHISVESEFGINPTEELIASVRATAHIEAAAYFLHGQALIRKGENVHAIIAKGIVPADEVKVAKIGSYMVSGALELESNGIVVGSELASRLVLKIGDTIELVSPSSAEGIEFVVKGIFTSGMFEYDSNLVYIAIAQAQELFGVEDVVTGLHIKTDTPFGAVNVKEALRQKFSSPVTVRTWMDMNRNLLAALKLEKTVMFIILALIVMVACFNIASTLIMTVLEKTKDIGILKAIGSRRRDIMAIFALQGGMIGLFGTALGAGIGLAISWALATYKFISLPRDIYYIDRLPVNLELADVLMVVATSLIISIVASIYPSYRASKLDPIEALRYE